MRRFAFNEERWQQREGPRRYEMWAADSHALHNAASVTVWQEEYEGEVMKPAEVDVEMNPMGVMVTSSFRFKGEIRIGY